MSHFYKKCKNLSKNEGVLGANEAQIEPKKEHGRSMVEMLGVLAIVGVLSIGAISGYRYAMNKYRANQVTNELNLLSHQVAIAMMSKNGVTGELKLGEPYDTNKKLTSSGYDISFGCGASGANADCKGETKYYMQVSGFSKSVCQELEKTRSLLQYSDTVAGGDCNADQNNMLVFAFDADKPVNLTGELETTTSTAVQTDEVITSSIDHNEGNPIESDEGQISVPEVTYSNGGDPIEIDPEFSQSIVISGDFDPSEQTDPIEETLCVHGEKFEYGNDVACVCERGYRGDFCEIADENTCHNRGYMMYGLCSCDSGYSGNNCEKTAAEICSGHGFWTLNFGNTSGYCRCENGYAGTDCSSTNEILCSGNGYWSNDGYGSGRCFCQDNWIGEKCTIDVSNCNRESDMDNFCSSCKNGFGGVWCTEANKCSGHGDWVNFSVSEGYCRCEDGYAGMDCSGTTQALCSGHGYWLYGECVCEGSWRGSDCSIRE